MPKPWKKLSTEAGPDLFIARARFDVLENPRTGEVLRRVVLDPPGWVNIVARTKTGEFVMVRQYRFGSETVTTEVPGGVIDPGEDPEETGHRELREETGYTGGTWRLLAAVDPNPAIQSNLCYQFLAEGVELTDEVELDPGEDIEVVLLDERAVLDAIRSREINHTLVISALARILDLRSC